MDEVLAGILELKLAAAVKPGVSNRVLAIGEKEFLQADMLYSRMFVYQDRSGLISSRPILSYGPPLGLLLVRDILPFLRNSLTASW